MGLAAAAGAKPPTIIVLLRMDHGAPGFSAAMPPALKIMRAASRHGAQLLAALLRGLRKIAAPARCGWRGFVAGGWLPAPAFRRRLRRSGLAIFRRQAPMVDPRRRRGAGGQRSLLRFGLIPEGSGWGMRPGIFPRPRRGLRPVRWIPHHSDGLIPRHGGMAGNYGWCGAGRGAGLIPGFRGSRLRCAGYWAAGAWGGWVGGWLISGCPRGRPVLSALWQRRYRVIPGLPGCSAGGRSAGSFSFPVQLGGALFGEGGDDRPMLLAGVG